MKIVSLIPDRRIKAVSVIMEVAIQEYLQTAKVVLDYNPYQRRRVIQSIIADLLKSDLKRGCTIPPIVLAIKDGTAFEGINIDTFNDEALITGAFKEANLLIIDGLQRTFVMIDLEKELLREENEKLINFYESRIRVEVYVGLDKLGILYRMLTLNTGQTTMSTRHLMEILYYDFFEKEINGIKLVMDRDKDEYVPLDPNCFSFKDTLDGFYSFVEGGEVLIERAEILDNVKTIKNLEKTENEKRDFQSFVLIYAHLISKLEVLFEDQKLDIPNLPPEYKLTGPAFGKDVISIFKRSQSMTGFGSALNNLILNRQISFEQIDEFIDQINLSSTPSDTLMYIVKSLDVIRNKSKKVGNDQRFFFKMLYKNLFDPEEDNYLDFNIAIQKADRRVKERILEG